MRRVTVFIILVSLVTVSAYADELSESMCKVRICNSIEGSSASSDSDGRDTLNETCIVVMMPGSEAVPGRVLGSESPWSHSSGNNFTRKSVTRIDKVIQCQKD